MAWSGMQDKVDAAVQGTLSPEELRALLASAHRPNFVIQMLAGALPALHCSRQCTVTLLSGHWQCVLGARLAAPLPACRVLPHAPACHFFWSAETIRQARLDPITRARMDDNLTFFEDAMGSCERILRTPIPLSYTRCSGRAGMLGGAAAGWLILRQSLCVLAQYCACIYMYATLRTLMIYPSCLRLRTGTPRAS